MQPVKQIHKLGNCYICGRDAAVNTPVVRDSGQRDVICYRCADKVRDQLLIGIKQHRDVNRELVLEFPRRYQYNDITLWESRSGGAECAWAEYGRRALPLSEEEKAKELSILIRELAEESAKGIYRCTGCDKKMKKEEIAGRPLFAGCSCKSCWEKHLEAAEKERRKGHVCRMCGKPYSFCYC